MQCGKSQPDRNPKRDSMDTRKTRRQLEQLLSAVTTPNIELLPRKFKTPPIQHKSD
jgi:hypothetical protein